MPWALANPYGILVDEENDAWHTGRINAVLPIAGTQDFLVGSDTGGVWACYPSDAATKPLSNDWADPDISTLTQGPDPSLVFAGTKNGTLYVSDVSGGGTGPLGGFRPAELAYANGSPVAPGRIWTIVFEPTTGRLVLACEGGLFWADMPGPGRDLVCHAAVGATGPFSDVALGPAGQLIAAARGPNTPGLFVANWTHAALRVKPAAVDTQKLASWVSPGGLMGNPVAAMRRTSIASCEGSRKFAYAVTAQADPQDTKNNGSMFFAVLRSIDGGLNWAPCGAMTQFAGGNLAGPGNQGDRNQAIAVGPSAGAASYNRLHVAMGMRRGPFVSTDGGDTWFENGDAGSGVGKSPHLHGDIHHLLFDPSDPLGNTLLITSDGGMARTRDFAGLAQNHDFSEGWETSHFNQHLPILQFCGSNKGMRGGSSAARDVDFLIGGGTQDNNTIWSVAGAAPTSWRAVEARGDGGYLSFIPKDSFGAADPGLGIATDANGQGDIEATAWSTSKQTLQPFGVIPVQGGSGSGLTAPSDEYIALSVVPEPTGAAGDQVLAVCGSGSNIYGYVHRSGLVGHWGLSAKVPLSSGDFISAIGSRTGELIYIGTNTGKLFGVVPKPDPTKSKVLALTVNWPTGATRGNVKMIVDASDSLTIAAYDARLMRLDTGIFEPVQGLGLPAADPFRGITCDDSGKILFAAFDHGVYVSDDAGDHWTPFSDGLPKTPHCSDLYVGLTPGVSEYLYVATWGRSVYSRPF